MDSEVSNELLQIVANAIRSTGHVTNSDKWEVAEAVIAALSAAALARPSAAGDAVDAEMVARACKAYRDRAVLTTNGKVLNQATCMEAALTAALTGAQP